MLKLQAHSAGVRTVMIMANHITQLLLRTELGITTDRSQAITGAQFDKISTKSLQRIETIGVYARVQPGARSH